MKTSVIERWREWNERTHGPGFELRRHFFLRFFDNDLVSTPGQWRVVAGGTIGIVSSLALVVTQSYYAKYLALSSMDSGELYRKAMIADHLFYRSLSMLLTGLFAALQWSSLFPELRDYLALAGLPVQPRQIFVAKLSALLAFAGGFIAAVNMLPSLMLSVVSSGRYQQNGFLSMITLFIAASMAGLFVFFVLVAFQGILLNLAPARCLSAVKLFSQGVLLVLFLCAIPLALSIPGFYWAMDERPHYAQWITPVWFLALDQWLLGNREESPVWRLALWAAGGVGSAALSDIAAYFWSYRYHRVSVLERSGDLTKPAAVLNRFGIGAADLSDPSRRGAGCFCVHHQDPGAQQRPSSCADGLCRHRHFYRRRHFRMAGFQPGIPRFHRPDLRTSASRDFHAAGALALCLDGLPLSVPATGGTAGELGFPVGKGGNRARFLHAVERFLTWFGVLPLAILTMVAEIALLGWMDGLAATMMVVMSVLILMDLVLFQFEKIPFTCSYLPGKRNPVETVLLYGIAVTIYIVILSSLFAYCLAEPSVGFILFGLQLSGWAYLRRVRRELEAVGDLEFEEEQEPAVRTLLIDRD